MDKGIADITIRKPARVGVVIDERPVLDSSAEFVRVSGCDLRVLAHRAAAAREDHPGVDVLADIEVVIAENPSSARRLVAEADLDPPADTVRYVGTPVGLAGLLSDIHALGIADGALLWPLLPGTAELIGERAFEAMHTMGALPESRSA